MRDAWFHDAAASTVGDGVTRGKVWGHNASVRAVLQGALQVQVQVQVGSRRAASVSWRLACTCQCPWPTAPMLCAAYLVGCLGEHLPQGLCTWDAACRQVPGGEAAWVLRSRHAPRGLWTFCALWSFKQGRQV